MAKKVENKVEYKTLDELYHLDRNPRTISKANMDKLVQSIKDNPDYFEARPIICSDRTGKLVIIAGNQRLRAADDIVNDFLERVVGILGIGVVFYAIVWFIRWLLLGGLMK